MNVSIIYSINYDIMLLLLHFTEEENEAQGSCDLPKVKHTINSRAMGWRLMNIR